MKLVIGNKNYSSWSMRPWILLRHFDIAFEEIRIPLFVRGFQDELRKYSPSLKVPVLIDDGKTVWDSLAICEYVSDRYLEGKALPNDVHKRAECRSYCAEMHSGFMHIRAHLPMNCRARRRIELSSDILAECERVDQLWSQALAAQPESGAYLFGDFSLADCLFAPMAMRFYTYGIKLSENSQKYVELLLANPAIRQWRAEASEEPESIPDYELGIDLST